MNLEEVLLDCFECYTRVV